MVRIGFFATLCFSLRMVLDGTYHGISVELVTAAAQTTIIATLLYGSVRGVFVWAQTPD